jgi:hypothetical protein
VECYIYSVTSTKRICVATSDPPCNTEWISSILRLHIRWLLESRFGQYLLHHTCLTHVCNLLCGQGLIMAGAFFALLSRCCITILDFSINCLALSPFGRLCSVCLYQVLSQLKEEYHSHFLPCRTSCLQWCRLIRPSLWPVLACISMSNLRTCHSLHVSDHLSVFLNHCQSLLELLVFKSKGNIRRIFPNLSRPRNDPGRMSNRPERCHCM